MTSSELKWRVREALRLFRNWRWRVFWSWWPWVRRRTELNWEGTGRPEGGTPEIFHWGFMHLEQMEDGYWWIGISGPRGDLRHIDIRARGAITVMLRSWPGIPDGPYPARRRKR